MIIVFDLDDTLFDEVDFVKSGFAEIAAYLHRPETFTFMREHFETQGSGRVFDALIDAFDLDVSLQKLIEIYRFHPPAITLGEGSRELLSFSKDFKTALITDGHYLMQQNKFRALGLEPWIDYPVFTDFYQTGKPGEKPFRMVMERFGTDDDYVYLSDNPVKDFDAPTRLGWRTIRFKNPRGVYRDVPNNAEFEAVSRLQMLSRLKELV